MSQAYIDGNSEEQFSTRCCSACQRNVINDPLIPSAVSESGPGLGDARNLQEGGVITKYGHYAGYKETPTAPVLRGLAVQWGKEIVKCYDVL